MNNVLDFEEEKTELELLGKINNVLTLLDEIDTIMEELPEKQSNIELLRSDLEHLLEDKEMGSVGYKNIARELEKVRKQRRHLKKAYEIIKCYQNNRNKITYKEQRPFVRQSLETCYKELQTTYNYRLLNAQNIKELLGNEKHTEKQDNNSNDKLVLRNGTCVYKNDLVEMLDSGMSFKEIGDVYGVSPSTITVIKRKLGIEIHDKAKPKVERIGTFKPREITLEMYNELKDKGYNQRQMMEAWGFKTSSNIILVKERLGLDIKRRDKHE